MTSTVTVTMATRGRCDPGEDRVHRGRTGEPLDDVVGKAEQEHGRHRHQQDQPLGDQRDERPVGGQIGQRPGEGHDRRHAGPGEGDDLPSRPGDGRLGGAHQATVAAHHQGDARQQGDPRRQMGIPGVGSAAAPRSGPGPSRPRLTPVQRLDRLERVTDLLLVLLDAPRPLSLREIADRVPGYPDTHGARRQAFERDKRLLRDEGVPVLVVPIDGEDQLGYRVDPDSYYLPDLGLEAEEQAALNLAVAGVHLGEPIGRDALLKLGAGGESPVRPDAAPLVDLRSSTGCRHSRSSSTPSASGPRCDSTTAASERHVDVAGLRFRNGHWYVIGFDRDRGEARTFRVDRIAGPPELDEPGFGPASCRLRRRPGLHPRPVAVRRRRGGRGRRAGRRGRVGPGGHRAG